jgi:hypothetical protein
MVDLVRKVEWKITRNGKRVMLERPTQKLTLLVEKDEDREESPPREPNHYLNLVSKYNPSQ